MKYDFANCAQIPGMPTDRLSPCVSSRHGRPSPLDTWLLTSRPSRCAVVWIVVFGLLTSGCVRRRLTVRSSPPGATVYVDDQEIGQTPVSAAYTYYGTRKIQLVKDGYETMTVKQRFKPPWYQIPPLDFISENMVPKELRDERIVDFELEPQRVIPVNELMTRAEQLRQSTQAGYTVAPPPAGATAEPPMMPASEPSSRSNVPPPFYTSP